MPTTYDQALNDLEQARSHAKYAYKKELIELNSKPFFSKNQTDALYEKIFKLEERTPYVFLFGVAVGIIATIVVMHL